MPADNGSGPMPKEPPCPDPDACSSPTSRPRCR
jgi:hypothetical protein